MGTMRRDRWTRDGEPNVPVMIRQFTVETTYLAGADQTWDDGTRVHLRTVQSSARDFGQVLVVRKDKSVETSYFMEDGTARQVRVGNNPRENHGLSQTTKRSKCV